MAIAAEANEFPYVTLAEQGSNPSAPSAGLSRAFWKSDGLYVIDDAGAVTGPYGAGGGVARTVETVSAATYTPDLADANTYQRLTNTSQVDVTIPANASVSYSAGDVIELWAEGAGGAKITGASGVTINGASTVFVGEHERAVLVYAGSDDWDAAGVADPIAEFAAIAAFQYDLDAEGLTDATSISSLADFSPNGVSLTQGTGANQPTAQTVSGMKVARFDGSSDYLDSGDLVSGFSVPYTYVILAKSDNPDTTDRRLINTTSDRGVFRTTGGSWEAYNGSSVSDGTDDANWHVFVVVVGSPGKLFVDGGSAAATGNMGTTGLSNFRLGARDGSETLFWDGDVAFVAGGAGDLTVSKTALLNNVCELLADRAGITWTAIA